MQHRQTRYSPHRRRSNIAATSAAVRTVTSRGCDRNPEVHTAAARGASVRTLGEHREADTGRVAQCVDCDAKKPLKTGIFENRCVHMTVEERAEFPDLTFSFEGGKSSVVCPELLG